MARNYLLLLGLLLPLAETGCQALFGGTENAATATNNANQTLDGRTSVVSKSKKLSGVPETPNGNYATLYAQGQDFESHDNLAQAELSYSNAYKLNQTDTCRQALVRVMQNRTPGSTQATVGQASCPATTNLPATGQGQIQSGGTALPDISTGPTALPVQPLGLRQTGTSP